MVKKQPCTFWSDLLKEKHFLRITNASTQSASGGFNGSFVSTSSKVNLRTEAKTGHSLAVQLEEFVY